MIFIFGNILQILGVLFSSIKTPNAIPHSIYKPYILRKRGAQKVVFLIGGTD